MTRTALAATFVEPNRPFVMQEYPLESAGVARILVRITMGYMPLRRPLVVGEEARSVSQHPGPRDHRRDRGDR